MNNAKVEMKNAKKMSRPGLEPGTVCVLDRRDNHLHHRDNSLQGSF